jgi:toxin-antitoxin system PIN domain toxin
VILVDTNIFIYASDEYSPFHATCNVWIEDRRSRREPWFTTWPIVYEFLRVTTHRGVLRRPWSASAVLDFVELLLGSPGFQVLTATPDHVRVARTMIQDNPDASGNLMHDLHTVVLMREHGIVRIATHDKDFARFRGIEVFDPIGH